MVTSCTTTKRTGTGWNSFTLTDCIFCQNEERSSIQRAVKVRRTKWKKGRGLEWHKKKHGCWNTEIRQGGRERRGAESRRKLKVWVVLKNVTYGKKRSKSWSCSYCFFPLLICHSFIFTFWRQMECSTSVWAYQVSGRMHGHDLVRTFWPEELITLTYI